MMDYANQTAAETDARGDLLLYLHIPKTAGTALADLLTSHFQPDEIRSIRGPDYVGAANTLRNASEADKARLRLVYGHFAFGLHEAFTQPCRYYTVLRDPIDRVMSLYYYIRGTKAHPRHLAVQQMTLAEFALSGLHPEIENCQTRMLSGRAETHFITGTEACTELDFANAIEHLKSGFVDYGLYEDLPRSLFTLCKSMGWKYTAPKSKNVTKSRNSVAQLNDEDRAALEEVNGFDIRLYEYAKSRFRQAPMPWTDRLRWKTRRWLG